MRPPKKKKTSSSSRNLQTWMPLPEIKYLILMERAYFSTQSAPLINACGTINYQVLILLFLDAPRVVYSWYSSYFYCMATDCISWFYSKNVHQSNCGSGRNCGTSQRKHFHGTFEPVDIRGRKKIAF